MAVTILSNKKNASVVIHVAAANASLVIAGNNSVSNVAIGNEVLTGATITQVVYGNDGGANHAQILRGANLVATFDSTGYIDYAGNGLALNKDSSANLVVNFNGSNSYCIIEMQKIGGGSSEYLVG